MINKQTNKHHCEYPLLATAGNIVTAQGTVKQKKNKKKTTTSINKYQVLFDF